MMRIEGQEIDCVVIGASLGGVEAINMILKELNEPLSVPTIITLHIPAHWDFVREAFNSGSPVIRIKEVEDKEDLRPGTIYFAPSDYHVLLEKGGYASLSSEDPVCLVRPSVDVLFESAARAYGDRVLALLLTGSNNDGTAGIEAVDAAGGLVWVQDPTHAQAPEMPRSALQKTASARIVRLEEVALLLKGIES